MALRILNRVISIGDLVLLKNDSTSRAFWKLGKVEELIPGRDGNVRAAVVKAVSDMGRPSQLRRVVQHLVPIEVKELKFHKEKEVLSQISLWLLEHGWCAITLDVDY